MSLDQLKAPDGATKRRKIVGRGAGSGRGKTCTRGHKGQKSRAGSSLRPGFEGGQMPLIRRIPKRGFTSLAKKDLCVLKVSFFNQFEEGVEISLKDLKEKRLVKKSYQRLKVIAGGILDKKITVVASKFTEGAKSAVVSGGAKYVEEGSQ